ncbi:MAG: hypothetical protein ACOY3X_00530 [Pseudomonadota bacterium]
MSSCAPGVAARLNHDCQCVTVDRARLATALGVASDPFSLGGLLHSHPHLFADSAVYVAPADIAAMAALIAAVERVVQLPAWQQAVLSRHVPHADTPVAARGVFFGFDFHPGPDGPQLIEINSNAGGALLNLALRDAQIACCDEVAGMPSPSAAGAGDLVAMFRNEWRLARGDRELRTVAIVDDTPQEQYLLPEFERFASLFEAHGMQAVIVDAGALTVRDGALYAGDVRIDLVYNRLTDFLLTGPRHAALAEAFARDLAVVTPHPRAWALYADKRNLVTLTDPAALRALGVDEETIAILQAGIPRTIRVEAGNGETLWQERKSWFFKPAAGYGSRAAYRGDKLTRGKWQEIVAAGDYVAQRIVPPGERRLKVGEATQALKTDLRNYVYEGRVQLVSARLYQGQTTNFRTAGGGFAAVFAV